MKLELFVDQPNLELKQGVQVRRDTKLSFQNETVEQLLQDLQLDTIMEESGTNGINSYKTKSHIRIQLNEGDILLFDPSRGYYLPHYPKVTIRQAIEDIRSLEGICSGMLTDEDTTDPQEIQDLGRLYVCTE